MTVRGKYPAERSTPKPGMSAPLAIVCAAGCIAGAWLTPVVIGRAFFIIEKPMRLLDVLLVLAEEGDMVVAAVIATFALAFPLAKLAVLLGAWGLLRSGIKPPGALLSLLEAVGKWAMLDVFVAALCVAAVKLQGNIILTATTGPAVAMLLAACLLTAFATWRVRRGLRQVTTYSAATGASRLRPTFDVPAA